MNKREFDKGLLLFNWAAFSCILYEDLRNLIQKQTNHFMEMPSSLIIEAAVDQLNLTICGNPNTGLKQSLKNFFVFGSKIYNLNKLNKLVSTTFCFMF